MSSSILRLAVVLALCVPAVRAVASQGPAAPAIPLGPAPALESPPPPEPAEAPPKKRADPFAVQADDLLDPYGRRPTHAPKVSLPTLIRYALDNPLVRKAAEDVEAMRAQVRKADFAWFPVIDTRATLSPGVRVRCRDLTLDDGSMAGFDYQFCYSGDDAEDRDFNINNVGDWFKQLGNAGVRFEWRAETIIPITTFGKIRNTKRAARAGLAVQQLAKVQAEQETVLRVLQAHNTLLLARESIAILREARAIIEKAEARVVGSVGDDDDWDAEPTADSDRDPNDVYKVKLAALDVDQLMRQALKAESLSLSALWALAGRAAPRGFDIEEVELQPLVLEGGLRDLAAYKEIALQQRPEAKMASAAVKAREYQEKLARANFLPDLGVILQFSYARSTSADQAMSQLYYANGFNYSRLIAALGLRWSWDFHNRVFDLRAARATRRSAEYQKEAARLMLGRDVEQAYGDLVAARHGVETAREAVDWSWKLVVSGEQRDSVGGGNTSELIRSLEKWYRKRFELEEAIQAHNDAVARLSRAVGTTLSAPGGRAPQADRAPSPPQ